MDRQACLGHLFRKARIGKGLTLEQIGEAIGMSGNGYGKIERGERSVSGDILGSLCRMLGVSPMDAIHEMIACDDDVDDGQSFVSFHGFGCRVGFTPEEWDMHVSLCRFAGISDFFSDDAYAISKPAIDVRRMRLAGLYGGTYETEE